MGIFANPYAFLALIVAVCLALGVIAVLAIKFYVPRLQTKVMPWTRTSPVKTVSIKDLEDGIVSLEEEPIDLDFHIKRNDALRRADNHLRTAKRKLAEGDYSASGRSVQEGLKVLQAFRDFKSGPPASDSTT
jgi:hypothetical protein